MLTTARRGSSAANDDHVVASRLHARSAGNAQAVRTAKRSTGGVIGRNTRAMPQPAATRQIAGRRWSEKPISVKVATPDGVPVSQMRAAAWRRRSRRSPAIAASASANATKLKRRVATGRYRGRCCRGGDHLVLHGAGEQRVRMADLREMPRARADRGISSDPQGPSMGYRISR